MIWPQKTTRNGATWAHIMQEEQPCERHAWQTLNLNSRRQGEDCLQWCAKCGALQRTPPVALGYG